MRALAAPRAALCWLEERANCRLTSDARGIAALDDAGNLCGMVAYDNVTQGSCEMHLALETPLALRALLPRGLVFPFQVLGLEVVVGMVPADNARMLALVRHFGFVESHRVRDGWAKGVDMTVQELRPEGCARWLRAETKEAA